MQQNLKKIEKFILKHHLLSLATYAQELWCCSMFYAYDPQSVAFIVASDPETLHMHNVVYSPLIAGTVALETKNIGKIQGIQFSGVMQRADQAYEIDLYVSRFPYALAMDPVLWRIQLEQIKMTDNTLGFGKKIIWTRETSGQKNYTDFRSN